MDYTQPSGEIAGAPYWDEDPSTNTDGAPVPAAAIENPQREIVEVINFYLGTPENPTPASHDDLTQLRQAFQAGIAAATAGGLRRDVDETLAAGFYPVPLALVADAGTVTPVYTKRNEFTLAVNDNLVLANPVAAPVGGNAEIKATVDAGGPFALDFADGYAVVSGEYDSSAGTINVIELRFGGPKIEVYISQPFAS